MTRLCLVIVALALAEALTGPARADIQCALPTTFGAAGTLQACINQAAQTGETVRLPAGHFQLFTTVTFPANATVSVEGVGCAFATNFPTGAGTVLSFVTTNMTGPALLYRGGTAPYNTAGGTAWWTNDRLANLCIFNGTPPGSTGGTVTYATTGADGIDILNFANLLISKVSVSGFKGNGILIDKLPQWPPTGNTSTHIHIDGSKIEDNGLDGVHLGGTNPGNSGLENITLTDNTFISNGRSGIYIDDYIYGLTMSGNNDYYNNWRYWVTGPQVGYDFYSNPIYTLYGTAEGNFFENTTPSTCPSNRGSSTTFEFSRNFNYYPNSFCP